MKYIRLFEDFFGNTLWSDKTFPDRGYSRSTQSHYEFTDYIDRMYNSDELERNTDKEDQLLIDIEFYLAQGDNDIQRRIGLLKKLLGYKKLYPEMLDPAQTLRPNDMVYRGMTMPFDDIHEAIDSCDSIAKINSKVKQPRKTFNARYLVLKGANTTVTSRQRNGFISASTSLQTASRFQAQDDNRWPIVAATNFGLIEDRCIMNPEFLNVLNPMDESETWILGNHIDTEDIYVAVVDPKFMKWNMKRYPEYANVIERIWRIYDDNRTKEIK